MLNRIAVFHAVGLVIFASMGARGDTVPSPVPSPAKRSEYKMALASLMFNNESLRPVRDEFISLYVTKDARIPPEKKESLIRELKSVGFDAELTEFQNARVEELLTEDDLALLAETSGAAESAHEASSDKTHDITMTAVKNLLETKYVEITRLSYPPPKASEPNWFTQLLWRLVPESDQCRGSAK